MSIKPVGSPGSSSPNPNMTYDDTLPTGTESKVTTTVNVSPTEDATRVLFGKKVEINYSSNFSNNVGGWLTASEKVVNTSGLGTHDKLVVDMAQLNITGGGVMSALCYEAGIASIGPSTAIGGFAGFYFPNLEFVPNIGNVVNMAALQNDHANAHINNRGTYRNGDLIEIAPPFHAGLVAGRYYSAETVAALTTQALTQGNIYVTYVHIPKRTIVTKLGFNVTTAAAGNARIALYKVKDGAVTTKVAESSELSVSTTGIKEATISGAVDSGTYALVLLTSVNIEITAHAIANHSVIGASSGVSVGEQAYIPFPYSALPAAANVVPSFTASPTEPHLWFRVGV